MLKKQSRADIEQKRNQNFKKLIKPTIYACSIAAVILIGILCLNFIYTALFSNANTPVEVEEKKIRFEADKQADLKKFSNIEIREILGQHSLLNSDVKSFNINSKDETYKIITSLNIPLQNFLIKKIDRLKQLTRGKPQRIAMVVMEPVSGKILALTGFDLIHPDKNPCFDNSFPAASIFKIITATAAIEELGFTPYTPLYFNGSKYTLYKSQLKNIKNKYTTKISFENAFAESVNPVFGKIGKNRLGSINLKKYANKFGFNKDIDSELSFEPSRLEISENPYQWAEVGCGFNNTTTISPIFGAMITSTIINDGKRVAPSIVEKIIDSQNDVIYYRNHELLNPAVGQKTASIVQSLMQQTIKTGTARKAFRGYNKDKILSKLVIGGKTGSIYNREHTIKYDWFTGFAKKITTGSEKKNMIAVSIVVGHGDYIGTRASKYGKMIIKEYYKNI